MSKGKKKRILKKIFGGIFKFIILLLVVAGIVYLWYEKNKEQQEAKREVQVPVRVVKPSLGTIRKSFSISGYIESESRVTVLPKISGTMNELYVKVGDKVRKGQTIAKIDSETYELQLKQAEASYLAAKSTYDRMKKLYESNAASKQNFDRAKSQYDATKSQYELAKLNLEYTKVKSPEDGVVLQKHSNEGALLSRQAPIVTIGDLTDLVVKAKIPEHYYHFFINHKDTMIINTEVPALIQETHDVTIKTIAPYISPETKTFETVCSLKGNLSLLRPGMFLYLTFVLEEKTDVYGLPFDTLVAGDTLWYVGPSDSTAQRLKFMPEFQGEEKFQIPEKYFDYLFIEEGQHFIREGQTVKVLNDENY